MKVFITKYALTSGIKVREVEPVTDDFPDMVTFRATPSSVGEHYHGEGREWHRTWEAALIRAENMRQRRIRQLEKQLKYVRSVVFTKPD